MGSRSRTSTEHVGRGSMTHRDQGRHRMTRSWGLGVGATASVIGLALLVLILVPVHGQIPPGNLIANPSFENDLSGWAGKNDTLARVAQADAPDGSYVVKAARTQQSNYWLETNSVVGQAIAGD